MITIPYGTEIPRRFNVDWNTYLPVVPKILSTYTDTSTPSSNASSLFNYYMNDNYPGVIVFKPGSNLKSILKIDKKTNTIEIGSIDDFEGGIRFAPGISKICCKTSLAIFTSSASKGTDLQCAIDGLLFSNYVTTKYDKELFIPYGLRMSLTRKTEIYTNDEGDEVENEYTDTLVITNIKTKHDNSNKKITIPYGLDMDLSSTEFSVYDDDETKNITFPKDLRMVSKGYYLRAWKPGSVVGADLKDQIQINYGFRVHAANPCLLFHKPGDTIDTNLNSPNVIQMPWGLGFTSDDTYLTIYKPGDSTKGIKLVWQTL
jgi:hypothetical protein